MRRWLAHHGVHTHTVCDDDSGRLWRYGRLYATVYDKRERERFGLHTSWHLKPRNAAALEMTVGGGDSDREITGHIELFGMAFWLTFDSLPRRLCERILPGHDFGWNGRTTRITEATRTGIAWHDGTLWWHGWAPDATFRSTDPWWMRWTFDPKDFLLGRHDFKKEILRTEETVIPMDGREYPARVSFEQHTWKRPRWPFTRTRRYAHIELDSPPTFPGKGENSWDIDDDAILAMGCEARTVSEAVGAYITAVLRNRERYGGSHNWQPRVSA